MRGKEKSVKNNYQEKYFLIKEINERIDIWKKSEIFKATVDSSKAARLECMEEEHGRKETLIHGELDKIGKALMSDDPEKIKAALKGGKV